jgi:hypothetical protein
MELTIKELNLYRPLVFDYKSDNVILNKDITFDVDEIKMKIDLFLEECDKVYNSNKGKYEKYYYKIHTSKNDTNINDAQLYSLRDGIQFLTFMIGSYNDSLWYTIAKIIGFEVALDDICIPHGDVENGKFKYIGETLKDLFDRIKGNGDQRWLNLAYNDILYGSKIQFYEKLGVEDNEFPNYISWYLQQENLLEASFIRNWDAITIGGLALISYYCNISYDNCDWKLFYISCVGQILGTDVSKTFNKIVSKCPTDFVKNNERFNSIVTLYSKITELYNKPLTLETPIFKRYAFVSISYADNLDRYLERRNMARLPILKSIQEIIDTIETIRNNSE